MTNQKFKKELNSLGAKAKEAKEFLLNSSVDTRNDALKFACEELLKKRSDLFKTLEQCSICYQPMLKGINTCLLPCGHCFHLPCIQKWRKRVNTCPLCRQSL